MVSLERYSTTPQIVEQTSSIYHLHHYQDAEGALEVESQLTLAPQ
jgi:hypothetical protein